jgi:hypothetical protein
MALSPYDQSIYDAGFKYVPQSQYLLNPFQIPQGEESEGNVAPGLPAIYQAQGGGGGGGALQAGDPMTNFDNFYDYTGNKYFMSKDRPNLDSYSDNIQKTFMGFPSYRQQELTGPDMGEYIASGTNIPLEQTMAGNIQSKIGTVTGGIKDLIGKVPSITGLLNRIGVQNFNSLPALDQEFIKSMSDYRGPTVFGENTSGLSKDIFGRNVESITGNYAQKVRDDFTNLGTALSPTGKIGGKDAYQGATFNPATGEFESDELSPEQIAELNRRTKMVRTKYMFDKKAVEQQEKNKRDAEKAERVQAIQDNQRTQRRSDGSGGGNLTRSRDQGGLGLSASQAQSVSAANAAAGMGGWGLADGGRVPYMMGGLANLVDIYD